MTSNLADIPSDNSETDDDVAGSSPGGQQVERHPIRASNRSNSDNSNDTTPVGALQEFIEDQRNVDPDKRNNYILMLARGLVDGVPDVVDLGDSDPFKTAIQLGLEKKSSFNLVKKLICTEIFRQNSNRKTNIKNRKIDQLFDVMKEVIVLIIR